MSKLGYLRDQFEIGMKQMMDCGKQFDWENKEAYANWIAQTHYYTSHTTRLLALSAALFPLTDQTQHKRFCAHVGEEAGHENLTLLDLRAFNKKIDTIEEFAQTSAFYQTQYYAIEHVSPYAFFGWILALEGLAVYGGKDYYKRTKDAFGEKATNFLRVHSEEDPDHLEKAFTYLEKIPEDQIPNVVRFYRLSCELYCEMVKACESNVRTLKKTA